MVTCNHNDAQKKTTTKKETRKKISCMESSSLLKHKTHALYILKCLFTNICENICENMCSSS